MKIKNVKISGLKIIKTKMFFDKRGFFKEIFNCDGSSQEYLNLSKLFINSCIFFLNSQLTQPFFLPGF